MTARPNGKIIAAFAAIYVIWGSTYLAVVVALTSLPPFSLMATRSLVGGAVLLAWARAAGSPPASFGAWRRAAVCGFFLFVGCHGVLAYAQQRVSTGIAAVLLATIPFWIALINRAMGDDPPTRRQLAFLVPGLAGVGLVAWQQVEATPATPPIGDILLLLGASLSWAVGTVLSERWSAAPPPTSLSGMELITGGIFLAVLSLVRSEPASGDFAKITVMSLAAWTYLTVAGTIVAFAAYIWLFNQVSPTLVVTYTFVDPIIAVALGWGVLGEQPTWPMLAGTALVILSVAGVLLTRAPANAAAEQRHERNTRKDPKVAT